MNLRNIIFCDVRPNLSAFGLDISDFSIKVAHLKNKGSFFELTGFNRTPLPEGIMVEGEIKKEEELVGAIKESIDKIKGKKLRTPYAVCSLPEQHSFVKLIQLPKMTIKEAREAIKWEAEANIPLSLDEVYLDWKAVPNPEDENHLNVLINAAPKRIINKYLDVLKKAGIEPVVFEVESAATARSLVESQKVQEPILIVDLGSNRTSFIIFSDNAIHFTSSFSVSNQRMIDDIASKMKIDFNTAQSLKFKIGLDRTRESGKVFNALLPSITKLVKQINDYIEFYKEHSPAKKKLSNDISKIILCGGGAYLGGLSNYLSNRLRLPVALGNPWINILKSKKQKIPAIPHKDSLAYSTVLGLAIKGANFRIDKN